MLFHYKIKITHIIEYFCKCLCKELSPTPLSPHAVHYFIGSQATATRILSNIAHSATTTRSACRHVQGGGFVSV